VADRPDPFARLVSTAKWLKDHHEVVLDAAKGLLPARSVRADGHVAPDHEPPAALADYPRTAQVKRRVVTDPQRTHRTVTDLGRIGDWLHMHQGWRGEAPAGAAEGVAFVQKVKLMGIPADVSWTVVEATEQRMGMTGTGPMGLTIGLWVSLLAAPDGTFVAVDAGVGGDPVSGPLGGSVVRSMQEALEASLDDLARLLEEQVESDDAPRFGSAPVLHHASGRTIDGRTPVLVGVGQVVEREPSTERLEEPAALAARALRAAADDAGVPALLAQADSVYAVASASWTYRDLGRAVADHLGIGPRRTVMSARFGGDAGQALVNEAAQAVVDGEAAVVLVCGAEAGATLAHAQKAGVDPRWPEQSAEATPDAVVGSDREPNTPAEVSAGLNLPVHAYALMEQALRGKLGTTPEEHTERITGLWSSFSEVAAANPYAWQPGAESAERLATADADNRMVSTPYPKLLCANLQVDLASGLVLTSASAAEAAGVPQDKWVFVHAGAAAYDEWFVSERGDLAASPAIRTIGEAALAHAGITVDDLGPVDLYSCFPAAVQVAAAELGLPVGDPDRPLTVTGGLTFAGGPGNNYGGHGIASIVPLLRADPSAYGLTTSLGWFATKHALGVYSATPPRQRFRSLHPVLEPTPKRPAPETYDGPAVVESFTVDVHRSGDPRATILSLLTPTGARVLVRSEQPDVAKVALAEDVLGWGVEVAGQEVTFTDRTRSELPPPPPMPVLLERRDGIAVVTINRPERRNAIDLATAELLEQVVDLVEADPDIRVAVLTGAGGTFSAGMDLKAAAQGSFAMTERGGPLGIASRRVETPLIAAVEGHALAGGCELALVAHLVVASREAQFGIPEPKRGLVAAAGGVLRLTQRLPRNVAMELALTGNPMPATRMAELGLVNRLAEPGEALDAALALAAEIVANAPLSVAMSKRIVEESPDWSAEEEFDRQSDLAGVAIVSEDAVEGVAAFAEKREPVWKGR
jgi:acetyl-CoA C-acetyltransferase